MLRHLPAVLGVVLLIGAIYVVQKEFRHLRLEDIAARARRHPARGRWCCRSCWTVAVLLHR